MRLLEHEAKDVLQQCSIPIPSGQILSSAEGVQMDGPIMLKAQVPVGGRGKAGVIVEISDLKDVESEIRRLLSSEIKGFSPKRVLVEEKVNAVQEFFLGIAYDTVAKGPTAIFSPEGGIDIEELAAHRPEMVVKRHFSVRSGLPQYAARELISEMGVTGRLLLGLGATLSKLADIFLDHDATLVEINPLALTQQGKLVALDCHMEIDDDALFRQPALSDRGKDSGRYKGGRGSTAFERKAAAIDSLDHRGVAGRVIEFDGTLGLIIGGGGASLTAFDAVQDHGGQPANYCEIGGNPSVLKVKELTKHLLSKPGVEKIAVIMNVVSNTRVDLVARGVIKGIIESERVPSETLAVFRVPGAWEEEGFKILSKYGVQYCDRTISIDEAARVAVQRTHGSR